jgi:hypothetical protein
MRRTLTLGLAALAALSLAGPARSAPVPAAGKKPKVEVVFCLDTTGSMSGLIDGAKQKIWAICNQIASGKPVPELKVGLVAYRDKRDEYVTRVFDLSDDLDAIHGHLKGFAAVGGGDTPESVNQALDDAVNKIKWSTDKKTLKILFLVGDAPPHMDYTDDVKYPETCKKAAEKGIIVNTIQCGNYAECTKFWREIADKGKGSYVGIAQDGGVRVVSTPFDAKLTQLNKELTATVMVWGGRAQRDADMRKNAEALALSGDGAASRIAYQSKNGQVATYCFLDNWKQGKVKLEDVKKEELPRELQGKTVKEQKEILEKLDKKRAELNKQVLELDRKRADYIQKKRLEEAKKGKAGFDAQVLDVLRKQAKAYEITY